MSEIDPYKCDTFEPGDVAVCILGGKIDDVLDPKRAYPTEGKEYLVLAAGQYHPISQPSPIPSVTLLGAPVNSKKTGATWAAYRFKKKPKHEEDAEDSMTIEMYRTVKKFSNKVERI